ncbi:MAG: hypothetical protein J6W52_12365 [Bacteroidaceae bacterium]|nr:hypothetical protein [Bacteroidaceae bacterium]
MINLNDITKRKQLAEKYLNAETTVEEERMLRDFYSHAEEPLTPEDEDMRLLMDATDRLNGGFVLSDEKAEEFDRLMQRKGKKSKIVALCWIVSAAAAIICVVFFLSIHHTDNAEKHSEITTSELLETITILSDVGGDDMTITASSCNDGFIIKTSTSNEPPSSYMLKRCSDGTSIELKSQVINF